MREVFGGGLICFVIYLCIFVAVQSRLLANLETSTSWPNKGGEPTIESVRIGTECVRGSGSMFTSLFLASFSPLKKKFIDTQVASGAGWTTSTSKGCLPTTPLPKRRHAELRLVRRSAHVRRSVQDVVSFFHSPGTTVVRFAKGVWCHWWPCRHVLHRWPMTVRAVSNPWTVPCALNGVRRNPHKQQIMEQRRNREC